MDIDIFEDFSMLNSDILSEYNVDCRHPNAPWGACCGCGLGGCKPQKGYEDYYEGWDI